MSEAYISIETDIICETDICETDIIRQAQNGSQAAYGELYQHHFRAIRQYIHKRVDSSCDSEDLTQTVFLKAWQALGDYQLAATPFRAWLYRIARNTVIDHYRSQRNTLPWDDLALATDSCYAPETIVLDRERRETMLRALALLRPTYREIIVQRFLCNMDYTEMAAELGHQVNNLRVLQHRALEALRRVLTHEATLGIAIALTLMLVGRYTVVEAAQALPGDRLYGLRTVVEETRLFLADDATDIRLHTAFASQRLAELRTLSQQGRAQDMATATSNFAAHIQTASAQLAVVAQAQPAVGHKLTDQFEQVLQQQSADLVDLASTIPPALRPTIQPALAVLAVVQTDLRKQDPPRSPESAEPVKVATNTPSAPLEKTAPKPTKANILAMPTPTGLDRKRLAQPTSIVTDAPNAVQIPEHARHRQSTPATSESASNQTLPADSTRTPETQIKGANVGTAPTSELPMVATPSEHHNSSAPASASHAKAEAQAEVSAPTPANPPSPTGAPIAPDHTQDHQEDASSPARTEAIPAHAQQSEHNPSDGHAPRSEDAPDRSDLNKDHRPKL